MRSTRARSAFDAALSGAALGLAAIAVGMLALWWWMLPSRASTFVHEGERNGQVANTSGRLVVFRRANHLQRQAKPASSTMSRNIDQEIADLHQEIQDLEKAIARQDPPLAPYIRAIAEAKIATLQGQIAAMKRGKGHQPVLSE